MLHNYSSAFSTRYAETRTSNFCKVVRQHTEGMVGSIILILLKIYFSVQQWTNFENPLRIDNVIVISLVYYFLRHNNVQVAAIYGFGRSHHS